MKLDNLNTNYGLSKVATKTVEFGGKRKASAFVEMCTNTAMGAHTQESLYIVYHDTTEL